MLMPQRIIIQVKSIERDRQKKKEQWPITKNGKINAKFGTLPILEGQRSYRITNQHFCFLDMPGKYIVLSATILQVPYKKENLAWELLYFEFISY